MLGSTNFQNTFDSGPFFGCNFSAIETAAIHSVNQMSNGDSQGEFQADGIIAEQFDPSTNASPPAEHVHPSASANPSNAIFNTLVSGIDILPDAISDASPGVIPLDNASSGDIPSGAITNALSGAIPPETIANGSADVIPPDGISGEIPPDTIANGSADVVCPDRIADASSGVLPPDAIANTSSPDAIPSDATANPSSGVIPPATVADALSGVIPTDALLNSSLGVSPHDEIIITGASSGGTPSAALVHSSSSGSLPGVSLSVEGSHDTIVQIVRESAEHCRQKGLDQNPVEILRCYQTQIIQGRMLEVNDPTCDCSEGETNQIFVNRDKVLDTGMDEIKLLTNKRLTLEVQFYGEVRF